MTGYNKYFESNNKAMFLNVIYEKLLKQYIKIRKKINSLMNVEFDSELVYDDCNKYIKTKIKSYFGNLNINFLGKKLPKENTSCKCLSLIL